MKKILVVFTGGTIGSRLTGATIDVDQAVSRMILNGFEKAFPGETELDAVQPMNVLSENFTPKHWKIISDCIYEKKDCGYDGVIVTHGSDTIPYTSAYLSYVFSQSQIPIVLTCSNYVLDHPKSNGQQNFNNSVLLITRNSLRGIFSVFRDDKGKNVVFLGTRMEEANPYNDQFTTCGGIEFGEIKDGKFLPVTHPTNPAPEELVPDGTKKIEADCLSEFKNEIFAVKAYPGLNYTNFCFGPKTKAVLCSLYHSSSNCVGTNEYSLTEFIGRCAAKNIDVYLMSFKNTGGEHYLTTKTIMEAGGIPLVNISFEAAYVKLNLAYNHFVVNFFCHEGFWVCLAYNQYKTDPKTFMTKEIYNEVL